MNCLVILTVISTISRVTYGKPQNEPSGEVVAQSEPAEPTSISLPLPVQSTSDRPIESISAPPVVPTAVHPAAQQPATENVTSVAPSTLTPTPTPLASANQLPMAPMYPNQVSYGMPYAPPGMYPYYPFNPFNPFNAFNTFAGYPQYQSQYRQGQLIPSAVGGQYAPYAYPGQQMPPYQVPGQYAQYQTQFPNPQSASQVPSPINATSKSTSTSTSTNTFQTVPETAPQPQESLTPTITSSTGESGSDINSLPPQVKEFMDMIPQILSMHENPAEQPSAPAPAPASPSPSASASVPLPRRPPFPFGLRKHPKALPLFKRKPYYPPYPVYNKYAVPAPVPAPALAPMPPNYYQY